MPYKFQIMEFMRKKASFLPANVRSTYFSESDEDVIKDLWTAKDAKRICAAINRYIEKGEITDTNMCPFCIKDNGDCNKCGYFQNHGCCLNPHSDYLKVLDHIYGTPKTKKGIMDYIKENCGEEAINELKAIVTKARLVPISKD